MFKRFNSRFSTGVAACVLVAGGVSLSGCSDKGTTVVINQAAVQSGIDTWSAVATAVRRHCDYSELTKASELVKDPLGVAMADYAKVKLKTDGADEIAKDVADIFVNNATKVLPDGWLKPKGKEKIIDAVEKGLGTKINDSICVDFQPTAHLPKIVQDRCAALPGLLDGTTKPGTTDLWAKKVQATKTLIDTTLTGTGAEFAGKKIDWPLVSKTITLVCNEAFSRKSVWGGFSDYGTAILSSVMNQSRANVTRSFLLGSGVPLSVTEAFPYVPLASAYLTGMGFVDSATLSDFNTKPEDYFGLEIMDAEKQTQKALSQLSNGFSLPDMNGDPVKHDGLFDDVQKVMMPNMR